MVKLEEPNNNSELELNEEVSEQEEHNVASYNHQRDDGYQEAQEKPTPTKTSFSQKLRNLFKSKKFLVISLIVTLIVVAAFVEPIRFSALNLVLDDKVEFVVVDDTTLAPIENAKISLGGKEEKTNKEGKATLQKQKFGSSTYSISKEAYNTKKETITIRPGGNFVGPVKLHSDGVPYSVKAINKLSREKITNFQVNVDDTKISAISNNEGVAIIKIPPNKLGELSFTFSSDGFIDSKQKISITKTETDTLAIELVPSGKTYFLSNRTGKVSVYSANLDGSDQVEVVPGVENDSNAQLFISPNSKYAALISKRNNQKDATGQNTMQELFMINLEQKTIQRISDNYNVDCAIDWASNNQFLYKASYGDWERSDNVQVKSIDTSSTKPSTIFANKSGFLYYFMKEDPSHIYIGTFDPTIEQYGLLSVDIQNKNQKRLFTSGVYQIVHTLDMNTLYFADDSSKWHQLNTSTQQVKDTSSQAENSISLSTSPNTKKIAWIQNRDGKGTIIVANSSGGDQVQATKGINVSSIVAWLQDDYIILQSQTTSESAQYIVHLPTGTITKISDTFQARSGYQY